MIIDSILETVAYGLVILGMVLGTGSYFVKTPASSTAKSRVKKAEKLGAGGLGVLCIVAAFILLIISTWVA